MRGQACIGKRGTIHDAVAIFGADGRQNADRTRNNSRYAEPVSCSPGKLFRLERFPTRRAFGCWTVYFVEIGEGVLSWGDILCDVRYREANLRLVYLECGMANEWVATNNDGDNQREILMAKNCAAK